jgi:hypothetical protein
MEIEHEAADILQQTVTFHMHGMKAAELWAALATLPPYVCLTTELPFRVEKTKLLLAHLTPK